MWSFVIVGGWIWGLIALEGYTDAGVDGATALVLFLGGCLFGFMWVTLSREAPDVFRKPLMRWFWLSVPVIGLGGLCLSCTHGGLALRMQLCESKLRDYAEGFRQHPDTARRIDRHGVGLFWVEGVIADENEVHLYTARSGMMDSAGIVYRPDGKSPESDYGRRQHAHLFGPWWWFWEKW